MMDFKQIRYFLKLAETQHLTRAAESLNITQSTLSHGLAQLEQDLGVTLFDRIGRGLKLSQAGESFKTHAARSLQEIEAGKQELAALKNLQLGTLRIGVIPTFMDLFLPKIVARFSQNFPNVKLRLHILRADDIEQQLSEGLLDMGIAFYPTKRNDIETEHMLSEELKLVMSKNNPLYKGNQMPFKEVRNFTLALLPQTYTTRKQIDAHFKSCHITPNIKVEMESVAALIEVCKESDLATIVPERATIHHADIHTITLLNPTPIRKTGLLWRKNGPRLPLALAFKELLQDGS
jgi:LysR family transcriptional regulator, cyn operon transcriptional activator